MIALYYAVLAVIAAFVYVLKELCKEKENGIGIKACYVVLFLIVLLFI